LKKGNDIQNTTGKKEVIIEWQKVLDTPAFAVYLGHCVGQLRVSAIRRSGYA